MKTGALITYIQRKAPDWDRTIVLQVLNEIQNMVFTSPNNALFVIDEVTGRVPVLTTTHGTHTYVLDEINFGYDIQFIANWKDYGRYITEYNMTRYYEPPEYHVINGTESSGAKIIFKNDPGNKKYDVVCWRKPQELTSENVQLEIPVSYHLNHVVKGVLGKFEEAEHGTSNTWQEFVNVLLPEMQHGAGKTVGSSIIYNRGGGY